MADARKDFSKGFMLDDWRIEPLAGCFKKAGHQVHVEPKVMEVLLCLARARGETVSRDQLLEEVWSGLVVSEEVLTRAVSELRSLLGDTAREKRYIRTLPKRGYALIATVVPLAPSEKEETTDVRDGGGGASDLSRELRRPPVTEPQTEHPIPWYQQLLQQIFQLLQTIVQTLGRLMTYFIGVILVAVIVAVVLNREGDPIVVVHDDDGEVHRLFKDRPERNEESDSSRSGVQTLAVLPFVNLSPDDAQAYFADGVSEDIRSALIDIPDIKVVARTSSRVFKDRAQDVREIGKILGVDALVEGTVRTSADRVRVTVQLTDTESGFPIWASSYDRKLADVFAIQQQIAQEVAGKLESKLADALLESTQSLNSDAYQKYLLGRHFWHQRTAASLQAAIRYFQEAIELQPDYALAYSGLADAYSFSIIYDAMPREEGLALARRHMQQALRIDPRLAEAHASKGMILELELNQQGARRAYERAIQFKPGYSMAHMWLGNVLMALDELELAYQEYSKALDRDPLHPQIQQNYLSALKAKGRYQEVIDLGEQFYAQSKSEALLKQELYAYSDAGRYDELLSFALRHNFSPEHTEHAIVQLINALIRLGQLPQARELLSQHREKFEPWDRARLDMALALKTNQADVVLSLADRIESQPAADIWKERAGCTEKAMLNLARANYWRGLGHYMRADYKTAAGYLASAHEQGRGCWTDPDIELSALLYRVDVSRRLGARAEAEQLLAQLSQSLSAMQAKGWRHLSLQLTQVSYDILARQPERVSDALRRMEQENLQPWGIVGLDPFFQRHLQEDEALARLFQPLHERFVSQQQASQNHRLAKFGL